MDRWPRYVMTNNDDDFEMERVRWTLGLANLNQVLDLAHSQQQQQQQQEVLLDSGKQSDNFFTTLFANIKREWRWESFT